MAGTFASLVFLTAVAPAARAYVYTTNRGGGSGTTVGRANLDGTGAVPSFVSGASGPVGVAVDGAHVYWANTFGSGTIGRANLDGSATNQSFISGAHLPCGVAVDGSYVYWANNGSDSIGRANLDGSGANQSFITGANHPCGVTIDGSYVYWSNEGSCTPTCNGTTIGRANLDGSSPNESFISGLAAPVGVAVNASYIYWGNNNSNTIGRANLSGTSPNPSFIPGSGGCTDFPAVDTSYIYWANDCATSGSIGRANLDGTGVNEAFLSVPSNPGGVAVDQLAPLTVSLAGAGAGSVTGSGISCPGTCSGNYALGQQVTLTATPAAGSTFAGWTGSGCSGTGTCVLVMAPAVTVTATFTANPAPAAPQCVLALKSANVLLPPLKKPKRKHASKQAVGTLALKVTCNQAAIVKLTGNVTALIGKKPKHGKQRAKTFSVKPKRASASSGVAFTLTVKLPAAAIAALGHGAKESVAFTLLVSNANGTSHAMTKTSRLRPRR